MVEMELQHHVTFPLEKLERLFEKLMEKAPFDYLMDILCVGGMFCPPQGETTDFCLQNGANSVTHISEDGNPKIPVALQNNIQAHEKFRHIEEIIPDWDHEKSLAIHSTAIHRFDKGKGHPMISVSQLPAPSTTPAWLPIPDQTLVQAALMGELGGSSRLATIAGLKDDKKMATSRLLGIYGSDFSNAYGSLADGRNRNIWQMATQERLLPQFFRHTQLQIRHSLEYLKTSACRPERPGD